MHSEIKKLTGIAAVLTGLLFACSTALYVPKAGQGMSPEQLREMTLGRNAYIRKCASCHSLILPGKYDASTWEKEVTRMSDKARLTKDEERQVIMYLSGSGKRNEDTTVRR